MLFLLCVQSSKLASTNTWSLNLGRGSERIVSVATKLASEQVHSQGVVLGNRNVLYKYINPNLVVFVTEGVDAEAKSKSTKQDIGEPLSSFL